MKNRIACILRGIGLTAAVIVATMGCARCTYVNPKTGEKVTAQSFVLTVQDFDTTGILRTTTVSAVGSKNSDLLETLVRNTEGQSTVSSRHKELPGADKAQITDAETRRYEVWLKVPLEAVQIGGALLGLGGRPTAVELPTAVPPTVTPILPPAPGK